MDERKPSRIFERVVATEHGSVRRVRPTGIIVRPRELELAFELELFECRDNPNDLVPATELRPGESLQARVRIVTIRHGGATSSAGRFRLRTNRVVLKLACPAYPDLQIESCVDSDWQPDGPSSLAIDREDLETKDAEGELEVCFELRAPAESPRMRLSLELLCGTGGYALRMCIACVELAGSRLVPAPGELAPFYVDTAAVVPANVAFLYVGKQDERELRMCGFHARQRLEARARLPEQSLCLAVAGQLAPPERVVALMHDFSRKAVRDLQGWLAVLLATHEADLTLIVVDTTDAEVPWELLELAGGSRSYLGVRADVVRWTEIGAHHEYVRLSMSPRLSAGSVARFLHGAPSLHLKSEEERLGQLSARQLGSMEDVLRCLDREQDLALLYIACHGAFITARDRSAPDKQLYRMGRLGADSVEQASERPFLELDVERLSSRAERSVVVFVNACQSARLLQGNNGRTGLPERFLARVAQGYIGTLADVTNQHASEMGVRILQGMLECEGACRPVRVLREIRKAYLEELLASGATSDDWMRFLHAFLYVYYGQPLAVLQLPAGRGGAANSREGRAHAN